MSVNNAFHKLKVAEVRRETPDAVSIRFDVPLHLADVFGFRAGQHLTLRTELDGQELRRNYSICMAPDDREMRIAVKEMAGGRFSRWANTQLCEGMEIEVLRPLGRFVTPKSPCAAPRYVALAGGSGITPVLSIIRTVLKENRQARFTLVYGNRDSASIMFLEELAGLKNRYIDRLEVYHILENEEDEIALFNGRLDQEKCDALFSSLVDVVHADTAFICGPGPMMDAVERSLRTHGVADDRILVERFSTSGISSERSAREHALQDEADGTQLVVTLDGRRSKVTFDAEKGNILENVKAAGLQAPYACKGGVCSTCRAKVLTGTVAMKNNFGLTAEEVAQGYVLTCQSVPTSREVSLTYDV